MSRFREIYSTERFAQVLDINTAMLARPQDVVHVELETDADGTLWATTQSDKTDFEFGTVDVTSWSAPQDPTAELGPRYKLAGRYIVTTERFQRIVGRIFGGPGYMSYQLAARPYDELPISGYANEETAFAAAINELYARDLKSLGNRIM